MIRLDDKRFVVNVEVAVSRQFLAWIISLGEGVTLVGPDNVVEMMNIEIDRLIKQYKNENKNSICKVCLWDTQVFIIGIR